jgi:hypothetical protein
METKTRTSIWIRLAFWFNREETKDHLALVALGVILGALLGWRG